MNERENPSRFGAEQEEQEWEGGIFDSFFLSFVSGAKGKTPQPTSIDHSSERFSPLLLPTPLSVLVAHLGG